MKVLKLLPWYLIEGDEVAMETKEDELEEEGALNVLTVREWATHKTLVILFTDSPKIDEYFKV